MNTSFENYLLKTTKSSSCDEIEVIQALWSNYGKISRYQLNDSDHKTVVVKYISLNQIKEHPRGWNTDISHNRKVKSYEVETAWYEEWSQLTTANCRIPKFIGSFSEGSDRWIVMEDLNVDFPLRKQYLNFTEVKICLKWLANFHGTFLGRKPSGLWEVGTYWHLNTRPDEFKKLVHLELKSKASQIDDILNNCIYQTIVHGDAKVANFCFNVEGTELGAVDFQYAGGGCGMKDVAYFLGSCLANDELKMFETALLDYYFSQLKSSCKAVNFQSLENEWRRMYPIACADFTRFLLGWMPTHQKINDYNLKMLESVLKDLS